MKRKITNGLGIVYLFTNDLFAKDGIHKFGITTNPLERKRIQSNSTPPNHPFYDEIIVFSKYYKEIEKKLKEVFTNKGMVIPHGDEFGGCEWINCNDNEAIISIYKEVIANFDGSKMYYNGNKYSAKNGSLEEQKRAIDCNLSLLGINDGDKIKCNVDGNQFKVDKNKILVENNPITLSEYMNKYHKRDGITNAHNGFQYFSFKEKNIFDTWQSLIKAKF